MQRISIGALAELNVMDNWNIQMGIMSHHLVVVSATTK